MYDSEGISNDKLFAVRTIAGIMKRRQRVSEGGGKDCLKRHGRKEERWSEWEGRGGTHCSRNTEKQEIV